ncbi:MAG: zinc ribbon domain-containing protein [Methanosarcinales archaeon]|nr:zinc ribbon domain-containing protein [Methanosarcinales archaeon]
MVKYCPECEIEMSDFANFCPECGSRLTDVKNDDELEETLVEPPIEDEDYEAAEEGEFEPKESGFLTSLDADSEDDVEDYENFDETPQAPASIDFDDDELTCVICGSEPLLKCRLCGSDICKTHGFSPEGMNILRTKIQNALRYANVGHIFYEYYPNWEGIICKTCLIKKFDQSISKTRTAYSDHTKTEGSRRKIGKALEALKLWKDKISKK